MRRVVITGIGIVSPIGIGVWNYWNSLIEGMSGIRIAKGIPVDGLPCKIASQVLDFKPENYVSKENFNIVNRGGQFAIASSNLAIQDSNLKIDNEDPYRLGVCVGTAIGNLREILMMATDYFTRKGEKLRQTKSLNNLNIDGFINAICNETKFYGYNLTPSTGCCSGNMAIAIARDIITDGKADVMLAGGVDLIVSWELLTVFCQIKSLSTSFNEEPEKASRPFDAKREGFILGESAGMVVLEELGHALKRNATIYAEVLDYGLTNDCGKLIGLDPDEKTTARAISDCLISSGLKVEDVDYYCANAHSAYVADLREAKAIRKIFGDYADEINISSIKSMIGHSMAGGSALQVITSALAIYTNMIPPTLNYENPGEGCYFKRISKEAVSKEVNTSIATSLGLGGTAIALALKKFGG